MNNETVQPDPKKRDLGSKNNSVDTKLPFYFKHFRLLSFVILAISGFIFFRALLAIESQITEAAVVNIARNYIQSFESFRTLYTSEVVETVRKEGIEVTHDYDQKKGAIPLPATLSRELAEHIARETQNGLELRLFSIYPFPWRKDLHKTLDHFEKDAFVAINKNKENPFYRIEDQNGKKVARYAKADVMREACVSCHNNHPQTPKSDWKVGDLRGILEVSFPIADFENQEVRALNVTRISLVIIFFCLAGGFVCMSYIIENYVKKKLK